MPSEATFSGFVTPAEARRRRYLYLPLTVPPGTGRIEVSYWFDSPLDAPLGLGYGNVVDIGIFDPRGTGFPQAPGFRGWSGSARRQFFIEGQRATPGYLPGPIYPGVWHIVLGFARVQEPGVSYQVAARLSSEDTPHGQPPEAGALPAPASLPGDRYLRGDLHSHSHHSDGENTVEELALAALEQGLDFLAITDHNTCAHLPELEALAHLPLLLLPGEEVTTYWGHANVWGLRRLADFRCTDADSLRSLQRAVLEEGGLISINHPKGTGSPWLFPLWEGFSCLEVWQGPWGLYNWESLERWDSLLCAGQRIVAVGGSDTHSLRRSARHPLALGHPTTWVYVRGPATPAALLEGIRQGDVFVSFSPEGPQLFLQADADGDGSYEARMGQRAAPRGRSLALRVEVRGGAGRRLWLVQDGRYVEAVTVPTDHYVHATTLTVAGPGYVRAELREPDETVWALTNPIWLDRGESAG